MRYLSRVRGRDAGADHRRPQCAFVLSGGGVYGAVQVGMIRALVEAGYVPDLVSAVSVGALNGVVIAQDPGVNGVSHLEEIWREVDTDFLFPGSGLHKALAVIRHKPNICENTGVQKLIDDHVAGDTFEDLKVPFFVTVTELLTGDRRVFHTGPIRQVLLATTALPGVFPPVEVDGDLMVDGGLVSNIPTRPAVTARPEKMFVLDVSRPISNKVPTTPLGMMIHAFNITRNLCASRDIEAARVLGGAVFLPRPDNEPELGFDDTGHTEELMEMGYERTRRFLAEERSEVA